MGDGVPSTMAEQWISDVDWTVDSVQTGQWKGRVAILAKKNMTVGFVDLRVMG